MKLMRPVTSASGGSGASASASGRGSDAQEVAEKRRYIWHREASRRSG